MRSNDCERIDDRIRDEKPDARAPSNIDQSSVTTCEPASGHENMKHPVDKAIEFCAVTLGLGTTQTEAWLTGRPDLDRQMALVAVSSDMSAMSVEFRVSPGLGMRQCLEHHATGSDAFFRSVPAGLKLLADSGIAEGLDVRHTFGSGGSPAAGEVVVMTEMPARAANELLASVGLQSPEAPALFSALAVHDGGIGFGWQFRDGEVCNHLVTRRVKFAGSAICAAIAEEVGRLFPRVLSGLSSADAWGSFAANQVRRLRPGEAAHTLDIRIITHPDGTGQRIELDFFALPTRVGVGLVQGFNLATDKLETVGTLQGILGTPMENGTTWLDRVRASYGRDGLGIELGLSARNLM